MATLLGTVVLAATFAFLYRIERQRFIKIWAISWAVYALRFVFDLLPWFGWNTPLLLVGNQVATLVSGLLLLCGTILFMGRRSPRLLTWVGLAGTAWIVAAISFKLPFFLLTLPTFAFLGVAYVLTGAALWRSDQLGEAGRKIASVAFILWGLHKLDFPFVRDIEWLAPAGFFFSALLEAIVAFALLIAYFYKTRRELADRDAVYQAIFDNVNSGVVLLDVEGHFLMTNQRWEEISGYTAADLQDLRNADLSHPADMPETSKKMAALFAGEIDSFRQFKRLIRKDGQIVWVDVSSKPIRDEFGKVTSFAAVISDVSDEKRAMQELEQSERRLRTVIDSSNDCIVITAGKPERKFVDVNPAALKLFGFAREELIGENTRLTHVPERYDELHKTVDQALRDHGFWRGRWPFRRRDGSTVLMETVVSPLADGSNEFVTILRDVSEEHHAAESASRLAAIVASSPDAIVGANLDGKIVNWNRGAEELFGYSAAEAVGRSVRMLSPKGDDHRYEAIKKMMEGGAPVRNLETVRVAKDGTHKHVSLAVAPIRDADGAVVGTSAIARDLTDQRRREAERAELKTKLAQGQKMEAIGRLAGGVAHDFNNVLTAILGYASVISSAMAANDPLRHDVAQIHEAAERASGLTHQLLAFSRRQVVAPETVNLNETIAKTERMLRRLVGKNVRWRFEPGVNLPWIKADPAQIDQILINLVVNARDAMPAGGEIVVLTGVVELDEAARRNYPDAEIGLHVRLTVTDSGPGISPEHLPQIFEPFFTTKESSRGTGLGLATVFAAVRQNQGFISVESEVGQGATFTVLLPATSAPPESAPKEAPVRQAGNGETILVVEDETMVGRLMQRVLENNGYRVLTAKNGDAALGIMRQNLHLIDMLLTDVVMPGLNGRELYDRIIEMRPELPVLFMSGYTTDTIARHGVLDDEMNFLPKPFTVEALIENVQRTLAQAAPKP
jgi:two-component system, cell cycle sensor histidine kinase and response regulator CckA